MLNLTELTRTPWSFLQRRPPAGRLPGTLMLGAILLGSVAAPAAEGDAYAARRAAVQQRNPAQRKVPVIPPKDQKLRVIIDTDARNEIDDLWAIALAVRCPDRFQIEGFVAANYDNRNHGAGPASVETSARAIATVLEKAGMAGRFPIKHGSPPLRYQPGRHCGAGGPVAGHVGGGRVPGGELGSRLPVQGLQGQDSALW